MATVRGKDYLKGILVAAVLSTIFDIGLILALSLVLCFMALISLLLLRRLGERVERLSISPMQLRGFKGEEVYADLELFTKSQRWISVVVSSIEAPLGVEVKTEVLNSNQIRLALIPRFAGSFKGLRVELELRDVLGLFARPIAKIFYDFVIESMPNSLVVPIPRPRPFLLALGERTAGTKGAGQEFYSIDDYQPYSETRDILWKRIARMPDERLLIRIRESNMPQNMTIGFLEIKERAPMDRLRFVDLASEGVGLMGRNLLASKCDVTILRRSHDSMEERRISSTEELADALIPLSLSERMVDDRDIIQILNESDVLVTGLRELEDLNLANSVSRKPTLLIDEEATPALIGEQSLIFRGTEDIRKLIARAVEK